MRKALTITLVAGTLILDSGPVARAGQVAGQAPEQPKATRPAPRLTVIESLRRYLARVGAGIDESKSTPEMVVTNYSDLKGGKVTIVIVNDQRKGLVGFYVYNFGNLKEARDREEVNKYLLSTNDKITIGGFFVDGDQDIGYKYMMSAQQLSLAAFESVYRKMAVIAIERRPEIRRVIEEGKSEKPEEKKGQGGSLSL